MKHIKNSFLLILLFFVAHCADYYNELKEIPEFVALTETIKSKKIYDDFPAFESWRLLVGTNKQNNGPFYVEEKEPGYFAGISRGLDYALHHVNESLSVELIEQIRAHALKKVTKKDNSTFEPTIGGTHGVQFNLVQNSNMSPKGLLELESKLQKDNFRKLKKDKNQELILIRRAADRAELYPEIQNIITNYETSPKNILNIITLIQDLFQLHAFNDANTRTSIILLQKELVRNNYTPVILSNLKRFAAYSKQELVQEIQEAQERFRKYKY